MKCLYNQHTYQEMNEKDEIIKDLGDDEFVYEHVQDCYDCDMGYNDLIYMCVDFRKNINDIKKLVNGIC